MSQADGQRSDNRSKRERWSAFAMIFCTVFSVIFGSGLWITRGDIVGLRKSQQDSAATFEEQLQQAKFEIDKRLQESGGLSGDVQARLKEVEDLSKTLSSVVARVGESKAQIEAIQGKIDSLTKDLSGGGPSQELAKLEAQLASIEANVSTLRQLEQQVRAVQEQAGTTSAAVRQLQDGFKAALDAKENPQINRRLNALAVVRKPGLDWIYEGFTWEGDKLIVNIRVENQLEDPVRVTAKKLTAGGEAIVLTDATTVDVGFPQLDGRIFYERDLVVPSRNQVRFSMVASPVKPKNGVGVAAVQFRVEIVDVRGNLSEQYTVSISSGS